jgi:hypothetical protein
MPRKSTEPRRPPLGDAAAPIPIDSLIASRRDDGRRLAPPLEDGGVPSEPIVGAARSPDSPEGPVAARRRPAGRRPRGSRATIALHPSHPFEDKPMRARNTDDDPDGQGPPPALANEIRELLARIEDHLADELYPDEAFWGTPARIVATHGLLIGDLAVIAAAIDRIGLLVRRLEPEFLGRHPFACEICFATERVPRFVEWAAIWSERQVMVAGLGLALKLRASGRDALRAHRACRKILADLEKNPDRDLAARAGLAVVGLESGPPGDTSRA